MSSSMKRTTVMLAITIILVAALWYGLNRSSDSNPSPSKSTSTPTQPSASTAKTNKVGINNFSFSPANITIKKGTTVTWTNSDSVPHTVQETDGRNGPKSDQLNSGQSYSFTFSETGQFHYHCSLHPDMIGSITVTD